MPTNINLKDDHLINDNGSYLSNIHSNDDKYFAIITKCGHCGKGYFIPIIFTTKCKDVSTAIEIAKARPRTKRSDKDIILDAFEVSQLECYLIKTINDHDNYLTSKDMVTADNSFDRRVLDNNVVEYFNAQQKNNHLVYNNIKLAEDYDDKFVLEKYFAPIMQGNKLVYQKKPKKDQLLHDFFKQNCIIHGIKRNNAYFLSMYYQMYGENNDLGIKFADNKFYYECDGSIQTCEIPPEILSYVLEYINKQTKQQAEENSYYSKSQTSSRPSAMDKFNRRLSKTKQLQENSSSEPQPGE